RSAAPDTCSPTAVSAGCGSDSSRSRRWPRALPSPRSRWCCASSATPRPSRSSTSSFDAGTLRRRGAAAKSPMTHLHTAAMRYWDAVVSLGAVLRSTARHGVDMSKHKPFVTTALTIMLLAGVSSLLQADDKKPDDKGKDVSPGVTATEIRIGQS